MEVIQTQIGDDGIVCLIVKMGRIFHHKLFALGEDEFPEGLEGKLQKESRCLLCPAAEPPRKGKERKAIRREAESSVLPHRGVHHEYEHQTLSDLTCRKGKNGSLLIVISSFRQIEIRRSERREK